MPVLVDDQRTILAGHGRVLAGRRLGFPDVPVVVARGWSDAKRRAYIIADNKLAENAGWDCRTTARLDADGPRATSYGGFSVTWSDWRRLQDDLVDGLDEEPEGLREPPDPPLRWPRDAPVRLPLFVRRR